MSDFKVTGKVEKIMPVVKGTSKLVRNGKS